MTDTFDPAHLLAEASLNRTVIPTDRRFPADLRGANGFDLLGLAAITTAGVHEVGARVAALLAVLTVDVHDVDDPGRGVEPTPWRLDYLRHWRDVNEVWLGGGTAARFGLDLASAVAVSLAGYGVDVTVRMADDPDLMPLVGVARTAAGDHRELAVVDFGHSYVKRGAASFDGSGALVELDVSPPIAVDRSAADAGAVVAFAQDAIARTIAESSASAAGCSVAAYVTREGVVSDPRSHYAPLALLADAASFVHDGTAAARAIDWSAASRRAVLMLGTAVGVGLVTHEWRRPVAHDAHVRRVPSNKPRPNNP